MHEALQAVPDSRPYEGFERTCLRHAERVALQIGTQEWRYGELLGWVRTVAQAVETALGAHPHEHRVGVLASRSLTAYGGAMAVMAAGATLVALNPSYPPERNLAILRRAGIRVMLVGEEGLNALAALLKADPACAEGLKAIVAPESILASHDVAGVPVPFDVRAFLGPARIPQCARPLDAHVAYLVFTSGSTGEPKGVAISHANLSSYMRNFRSLAAPWADDRVATTYELTFDVALHDLMNAWWSGATLVVMPERAMMAPARFILDQRITVWFSVASFAMLLQKQGLLRPGLFPSLRISMLCGEALPVATAAAWASAAPNSQLFNVWGPTETTMELSFYRWDVERSADDCRRGLVPIGTPFADHAHVLLDDSGQEVVAAGTGELYVSGPQVGLGYWQDSERTARNFVHLAGREGLWYKTGDRVERDVMGVYHFVSRVDFMVKVRGHRIELGEVENALRRASGVDLVAVIPRPAVDGLAQGLIGFVCRPDQDVGTQLQIRERLNAHLPRAWIPDEIRLVPELPMNANRKLDRSALAALVALA
jgi:amino acid adenylation domain-containing protein